jgi:hypothetical protein
MIASSVKETWLEPQRSPAVGIEMKRFVQNENIVRYRRLIAVAESNPSRDEVRYQLLLLLLAEEQAKPLID